MKNGLVLAVIVFVADLSFGTELIADEEWTFERVRGGGYAQVCSDRYQQQVCAVVYCGRGTDNFDIGITGWEPGGQGEARVGPIQIDDKTTQVTYLRENNPIVGEVWRIDAERGERSIINLMRSGYLMEIDIARKSPGFQFSLDGSSDAIGELQERCHRRSPRLSFNEDRNVIRFGDSEFGVRFQLGDENRNTSSGRARYDREGFGGRWVKIASNKVDRRKDRDVVKLGREDGRFDELLLRALKNDVRVRRIIAVFGNGQQHELDISETILREGDDVAVELRGRNGRFLDRIVFVYDTRGRGPSARVEVWGRRAKRH